MSNIKYQNDIMWVSQNTTLCYGVRCQKIDNMFRPFSIRPSSGLTWPYRKGPKHVYLLTPYTAIKCCVLTHPPDIILIFDVVITHNGDEPLKDRCRSHCSEFGVRFEIFRTGDYEENMVFRYVTTFSLAETYDVSEEPAVHVLRIS